ncbi:MAG: hypothetical protein KGJ40_10280 [candidate division NC10 bacterium]|nr:hypothetical protein [candidate division NC10 bacterium]MDE2484215.1 hypothetical protein [candidate division NC10 bacterium]
MEQDPIEQPDRRSALRILGGGLVGLLIGLVTDGPVAAGIDGGLPGVPRHPRPATPSPTLFSGKLAETYRIAKEAPELLEQMPCYCGCYKSADHRNNLDCYADRHADT